MHSAMQISRFGERVTNREKNLENLRLRDSVIILEERSLVVCPCFLVS